MIELMWKGGREGKGAARPGVDIDVWMRTNRLAGRKQVGLRIYEQRHRRPRHQPTTKGNIAPSASAPVPACWTSSLGKSTLFRSIKV